MQVVNIPSEEGKKRAPPSSIQCPNCGHWKHPRASKCKENGCQCDCVNYQRGIKKKRQRAAIDAADGEWHSATHRRVIHQVRAFFSFSFLSGFWSSHAFLSVLAS